ncbi:non-ribosomal peptide synthetase [Williamsia sp.]|uniref:non-ribosomal peptide synthetase n=1 Tax=Williamsia sp. TaxID=1872085 RepID=UPI001A1A9F5A|nr:non-ribosomal peptide synthetase [Williamsia sp.]MBJ7288412.1 non-ribosomal peptide synthetase [Williamsia sp.]
MRPPEHAETVGGLLTATARSVPGATAIVTSTGRISYRDLLVAATGYARHLALGDTWSPVAVHQDGTVDAVARSLGVMMSGRALVAIDTGLPAERVARIVDACTASTMDDLPTCRPRGRESESSADVDPDAIAMICYTSGSTGDPKGVMLAHRTLLAKVRDIVEGQGLRADDRLGDLLPLGFSAGMNTVLAGIACGATVVCADPRDTDLVSLATWLRSESVTTLHSSVVAARALGSAARSGAVDPISTVRQVAYYGEAATGSDVEQTRHVSQPAPAIVNWYAATEVGMIGHSVLTPHDALPVGRIAAGHPLPDRRVHIVDEHGFRIDAGSVGEVVVVGGPIAAGYLGRASTRFFTDEAGVGAYRTGDRGHLGPDGTLHLAGRVDDAVKIRGYLVEPGEVESALYGQDGVQEAFVCATDIDGGTELVAYVSGPITAEADSDNRIRGELRSVLPEWMVPRYVVALAALPRTERGKLDRAALPEPRVRATARRRRGAPDIVDSVARYAVTLAMGTDDIDADADLMALGADSLALARISTTVRQRINGDIDFAAFTTTPTIAVLATSIRDHYRNGGGVREGNGVLVPIRTASPDTVETTPLFVVAGAGGPASSLMAMARHLTPGRPVHGLQALGLERTGRPDRSVTAMARRYVDLITAVAPHGPYLLAGHSMGGVVALEMSAQLAERGEQTRHLIAIDTSLSEKLIADLDPEDPPAADPDEIDEPEVQYQPDVSVSKRQLVALVAKIPLAGRVIFDPVTQWIIFYRLGGRLTDRHRLRRIDAPITVLAAPGTRHRRQWWQAVTSGAVDIRPVRGGHVELLHEPYVGEVATIVDDVLDA